VTAFSNEIHDCPMILATLEVMESEVGQLPPSKTTAEQDGNNRAVAFAFERREIATKRGLHLPITNFQVGYRASLHP